MPQQSFDGIGDKFISWAKGKTKDMDKDKEQYAKPGIGHGL